MTTQATLNERIVWEETVKDEFCAAVLHEYDMSLTSSPFEVVKENIIISMLSDVQELIDLGLSDKATDMVNRIKFVTRCVNEYHVADYQFYLDIQAEKQSTLKEGRVIAIDCGV